MDTVDGPTIARKLGVSSKQVWTWYQRRHVNNFPEPTSFRTIGCRPRHKPKSRRLWNLNDVLEWHASYVPARGGAGYHVKNRRST